MDNEQRTDLAQGIAEWDTVIRHCQAYGMPGWIIDRLSAERADLCRQWSPHLTVNETVEQAREWVTQHTPRPDPFRGELG